MGTEQTGIKLFADRYREVIQELEDPTRLQDEALLQVKLLCNDVPFILPYLHAIYKDLTDEFEQLLKAASPTYKSKDRPFAALKEGGFRLRGGAEDQETHSYESLCNSEPLKSRAEKIESFALGLIILSEPRLFAFCLTTAMDFLIADSHECPILVADKVNGYEYLSPIQRHFYTVHCDHDNVAMRVFNVIMGEAGWDELSAIHRRLCVGDWSAQAKKFSGIEDASNVGLLEQTPMPGSSSIHVSRTISGMNSSLSSFAPKSEESVPEGERKRKFDAVSRSDEPQSGATRTFMAGGPMQIRDASGKNT